MNATSGFDGSEAVVLPDPLIVLQSFINFIFFPLYMMADMARLPVQLPMPQQAAALPTAKSAPAVMQTNEERWVWRDYKGREREITVYRKVKGRSE